MKRNDTAVLSTLVPALVFFVSSTLTAAEPADRTLRGHTGSTTGLAWHPDGKLLACGCFDKTIGIWDVETGKQRQAFAGHTHYVYCVAWNRDGTKLASASYDGTVRLWDARTGRELWTNRAHTAPVLGVAWSPDGSKLASGSLDKTVQVLNAADGKTLQVLKGHTHYVISVSWSPDGKTLASGGFDHVVRLWDPIAGKASGTLAGHTDAIEMVYWSPDGEQLASGGRDLSTILWAMPKGRKLKVLKGHSRRIESVSWTPDGTQLATGSQDMTVKVWSTKTGKLLRTLNGHEKPVRGVVWSPNGRLLASGSDDHSIRIWDMSRRRKALKIGSLRQLFLDDHIIERIDGLKRTMHQPVKRGAVIKPDQEWETSLQTRCSPAWDEQRKRFKLWLITSTNIPGLAGTSYAESKDGVHWTKPILRQTKINGSLENNFLLVVVGDTWPKNGIENVVLDPDDPDPSRRYKGFYGVTGRRPMVSPDGIRWTLLQTAVLPSSDESNMSYDRADKTFIATLKRGGPFGRSHRIWTSRDFTKWTDTGVLFHADELDQKLAKKNIAARLSNPKLQQPVKNVPADYNADIYNFGVFRYEGLFIGMPAVYHATGKLKANTDGFHLIQLACSRDLRKWMRLGDRQPFIGPSPAERAVFDRTQLLPPSAPVERGDELWFYYTGIKYRASPENADKKMGAVCLAVLRRDGFISLDAGEADGSLITQPFLVSGEKLFVNANVRDGGRLLVEVLDKVGEVLATSNEIKGDHCRGEVTWADGKIAAAKGQPVKLRFTLRETALYSFWIDQ